MNDNCPNCCEPDVEPAIARRRGNRTRHGYQCPRCRQQWITERLDSAYRTQTRKAA
jgi:transposase-like protein